MLVAIASIGLSRKGGRARVFGTPVVVAGHHGRVYRSANGNDWRTKTGPESAAIGHLHSDTRPRPRTATRSYLYIAGEHFPPCRRCGHHPRFKLKVAAHHIFDHSGSVFSTQERRARIIPPAPVYTARLAVWECDHVRAFLSFASLHAVWVVP